MNVSKTQGIVVGVLILIIATAANWPRKENESANTDSSSVVCQRHYHGQTDVSPGMPITIDVFMEDQDHTPVKILLALRGDRFSPVHYTEIPKHVPSIKSFTQPEFALNMSYADLSKAGEGDHNLNVEHLGLIVSADNMHHKKMAGHRSTFSDSFDRGGKRKMIARKTDAALLFDAVGQGGSVRSGSVYEWANGLRIVVKEGEKEKDITAEFLARSGKSWQQLGNGKQGGFNGESSGLVDVTSLVDPQPGKIVTFELSLKDSGAKIHYDLITE